MPYDEEKLYEVFHYSDEDYAEYLDEIAAYHLIPFSVLNGKREYGIGLCEAAFMQKAEEAAALLAAQTGLNVRRTRSYIKLLFAAMPAYGKEGLARIAEYARMHPEMRYDEDFAMQALMCGIDDSMCFVEARLPETIKLLMSDEEAEPEMEVARLYKEMAECLKPWATTGANLDDKSAMLNEMATTTAKTEGLAAARRMLAAYKATLPYSLPIMDEESKRKVYATLDMYRENQPIIGLYKFFVHAENEFD